MQQQASDFDEFVMARSRALLAMAHALTGNRADAEDLLQTAFSKTYSSWSRIRDTSAVEGYVRRTMVNTYISSWRRRRSLWENPTAQVPDRPVPEETGDVDRHDMVWTALRALPPRQRATVVLRYYEDLNPTEIARVLGVSVGTVKSTTSRALAALRASAPLIEAQGDPASGACAA